MKFALTTLSLLLFSTFLPAQEFLNGDFEDHLATNCLYNNPNDLFNNLIDGVVAFGDIGPDDGDGEVDFQTYDCYVQPPSGDWCLGLAATMASETDGDAISLELSEELSPGGTYKLSFQVYGNIEMPVFTDFLEIGISTSPTEFGDSLTTVYAIEELWWQYEYEFEAQVSAKYITVRVRPGSECWTQIDDFKIQRVITSSSKEEFISSVLVFPNPVNDVVHIRGDQIEEVRLFDLSGRLLLEGFYQSENEIELSLDAVPSGYYQLEVVAATYRGIKPLVKAE